ncbi:MAG: glycosyltransferase family 4 protein [Pyrinomonadaceae bacterium]|nr:glycosyltransferase family 4 protein [Pyrinomonadaceae bacterium]
MSQRPLKFCMVTTFYPPYSFGGDGIFVYRLVNELAQQGHRVEVVHCVDAYRALSSKDASYGHDDEAHPNVTVHRLHSRAGALSPFITQQTGHPGLKAKRLKEIINGGGFDVIHFHNISLIGPKALAYGTGIKLYTMHEHWLVCPMHVLWKFDRMPCSEKNCLACTIHGKRPPQLWRYTNLLDRALHHIDAFIAPSRFTWKKHLEMGLNPEVPIVCIPHFLPRPATPDSTASDTATHPRPYCIFAGRLEKLKGVQVLIEAFRNYRACDLLIAGDGNYEAELRRLAEGLSHVHFLGRVKYERLQALYRNAIAVMIPSVGFETFAMVNLEAFAQRAPVIVNNLGPLPEIVEESGGGLVYDGEVGLLEALDALLLDPDLRRSLGERAHQAYLRYWTAESHLQRYFELIEGIAAEKRQTAGAPEVFFSEPAAAGWIE